MMPKCKKQLLLKSHKSLLLNFIFQMKKKYKKKIRYNYVLKRQKKGHCVKILLKKIIIAEYTSINTKTPNIKKKISCLKKKKAKSFL